FLGADGRALGGEGNDKFYVQEGGGNLISGGAGVDQFWIVNGDLPAAANTILDFSMGTDVLGIGGQGAGFGFDDLTLSGNSIIINGITVAVLNGVNTATLTAANFAFV
ncbi:MAG: glycerophosphodiester phosphodiesterase, partial [Sphaerospermopsis kisseleviana]